MFDIAEVVLRAGDGGNGAVSFRREKGVPRGGPNGGNGGRGGDAYLIGRSSLRTLRPFHFQKTYSAEPGENGRGKDQYGKGGEGLEIEVPCGTVVYRKVGHGAEVLLGEVLGEGERLRVARGGRGGRGNATFTSPTQQAPYIAEKGEDGEECLCRLELKLIADLGIIGKPNAGKSTLLSAASAARPKIAPYPFTTLEPQLGVVDLGWKTFVLAEIPGLLEGAHLGIGLGHEFLRHATRTRLLIHLVDGSAEDVERELKDVNNELEAYGSGLDKKRQIVVINKTDMPEVAAKEEQLRAALEEGGKYAHFISAAAGTGVIALMEAAASLLDDPIEQLLEDNEAEEMLVTVPAEGRQAWQKVVKEDDVYVVLDQRAVRLVGGSNLRVWAGRAQLKGILSRMGVTEALEAAGVESGDTVRFGEIELEW